VLLTGSTGSTLVVRAVRLKNDGILESAYRADRAELANQLVGLVSIGLGSIVETGSLIGSGISLTFSII